MTIVIPGDADRVPVRGHVPHRLLRAVGARWLAWRDRRKAVAAHIALVHLDEKLLYDIGVEPLDLITALRQRDSLMEPQWRQAEAMHARKGKGRD